MRPQGAQGLAEDIQQQPHMKRYALARGKVPLGWTRCGEISYCHLLMLLYFDVRGALLRIVENPFAALST